MSIFDILSHQWRERVRAPTFGRKLVGGILLVLATGYFGILLVALGWFYPNIVSEVAPEHNPLQLLNTSLLYAALGLVALRFFFQRSAGSDVRPYMELPLRRAKLARIMQVLSAFSWFNLLPVILLGALWKSTVLPSASLTGAVCWAVGAILVVAATEFLNSLLRAAWDWNATVVHGAVGVLATVLVGSNWMKLEIIRSFSEWLFGGLLAGQVYPLLILSGGAGAPW